MSAVDPTPRKPGRPPRDLTKVPADPATDEPRVGGPVAGGGPREDYVHTSTSNQPVIESPIPRADPNQEMRDALAEMREQIKAEVRAEMASEKTAEESAKADTYLNRVAEPQPAPGEGTLVHFVADGMTVGSHVYYRGEELLVPDSTPWLSLDVRQQRAVFGHQMFGLGPWPGGDFDLTDPALSETDRLKLADVSRQRAQRKYP